MPLYNRTSINHWNHIQQLVRLLLISLELKIREICVILVKHFVGSFVIESGRLSLRGISFVRSVVFESLVRTVVAIAIIVSSMASTGVVIMNSTRSSRLLKIISISSWCLIELLCFAIIVILIVHLLLIVIVFISVGFLLLIWELVLSPKELQQLCLINQQLLLLRSEILILLLLLLQQLLLSELLILLKLLLLLRVYESLRIELRLDIGKLIGEGVVSWFVLMGESTVLGR